MTCCFIGHRKINDTPELHKRLENILRELIENGTKNFVFGNRSEFNSLCYNLVTELKEKYPEIKRIYFRCNYEDAGDYTMQFLINGYEECICPKGVGNAGRASYVERNQAMIRESDVCIFYYDEKGFPFRIKNDKCSPTCARNVSGTAHAYNYAEHKNKIIINCFRPE